MREVCLPHGPSLHLGRQLCRPAQPQVLPQLRLLHVHLLSVLRHNLRSRRQRVCLPEEHEAHQLLANREPELRFLAQRDHHLPRQPGRSLRGPLLLLPALQHARLDQDEQELRGQPAAADEQF